jgi:NAD(P)-dependent dehydrogenase (short-subunit alcohol dehydrogenase family)
VTNVSIYVALITGGAGAIGAALPQAFTFLGDNRQASRDRKERGVNAKRQACIELLGTAAGLRTRVANTAMYGGEILDRLAEIRSSTADVQVKAAKVSFLESKLVESAGSLAQAAADLAAEAITNTNTSTGVMIAPSFTAFDAAVEKFKSEAIGNEVK